LPADSTPSARIRCSSGRNRHSQVGLDAVLAGENLTVVRLDVHRAFPARSSSAANAVKNDAGLTRRIDKGSAFMYGNLLAVWLEEYSEMLHLSYCVSFG